MDDWSSAKLGDVANLVLGMILFFSPWLFGLSAGAQWQTASVIGIFIAVLSIAALAAFAVWEEWLNLVAGLWLIVSPWLLGFQDSDAMTIDVVIGAIVVALAAFEVWLTSVQPPIEPAALCAAVGRNQADGSGDPAAREQGRGPTLPQEPARSPAGGPLPLAG